MRNSLLTLMFKLIIIISACTYIIINQNYIVILYCSYLLKRKYYNNMYYSILIHFVIVTMVTYIHTTSIAFFFSSPKTKRSAFALNKGNHTHALASMNLACLYGILIVKVILTSMEYSSLVVILCLYLLKECHDITS